ncbi:hypothetical protein NKG94_14985 [Micromonospora sp. M12]
MHGPGGGTPPPTRWLDTSRLLTGFAALAAAVVAVVAGVSTAAGDRRGMVLPLAAVAGSRWRSSR